MDTRQVHCLALPLSVKVKYTQQLHSNGAVLSSGTVTPSHHTVDDFNHKREK